MAIQSLDNIVNEVLGTITRPATKTLTKEILVAAFAAIGDITASGDKVRIHNFGTFSEKTRSARVGRNPATGEAVNIPETTTLRFKATKNAAN